LRILFVSNLYGVPWDKQRGAFNQELVSHLRKVLEVDIVVLVPLSQYIRHVLFRKDVEGSLSNIRFVPVARIPRLHRFSGPFYALAMRLTGVARSFASYDWILASWLYPDSFAVCKNALPMHKKCISVALGTDVNHLFQIKAIQDQIVTTYRNTGKIVTVSEALRRVLIDGGVDPNRVKTIYNGVDTRFFFPRDKNAAKLELGLDPGEKIMLFVGSLIRTKGVFELVEASKVLLMRGVINKLIVIGKGAAYKQLRDLVATKSVGSEILFKGSIAHKQLPSWFQCADLFCLPSHREGVPNVLMEAMACGIPSVATAVGGIPEVLNKNTGVLCEPQNVSNLIDAVERAMGIDWDKNVIVSTAQAYTWDKTVRQYLDVATDLVNE
jgi:glycosyltransferase involved in cell wall biosynthesis